ncbi:sigma-70 family RNA polymerase sigma factor [Amycolatopsis sp. w19]|uniref:sigma-70 family RNA polymerase sigma factor n=1 Tax=Amycolatopsis sp. w19 TaxID=3448134 RepID=UPI003F19EA17
MTPPPVPDDLRFDVDHVMNRAQAANDADIAEHGRVMPTMAHVAEIAYQAFEIGMQMMATERFADAIPWLSTAVDYGIDDAEPMHAICVASTDPIPQRREAHADEQETSLAAQLTEDAVPAEDRAEAETPIFDQVLAAQLNNSPDEPTSAALVPDESRDIVIWGHRTGKSWQTAAPQLGFHALATTNLAVELSRRFKWDRLITPTDSGFDFTFTSELSIFFIDTKWLYCTDPVNRNVRAANAVDALDRAEDTSTSPTRRVSTKDLTKLVMDAKDGQPLAVRALLEVIQPAVVTYCRARLSGQTISSLTADDVAQEVCITVLTALPRYHGTGDSFLRFVYSIANNKVTDVRRAAQRDSRSGLARPQEPAGVEVCSHHARDLQSRLSGSLGALTKTQQEVVTLRMMVGLSGRETAEALGLAPGAVRVIQHQAIARMRQQLDRDESTPMTLIETV